MRLLLDTHILLWSLLEPERLSTKVSDELVIETNELWLSPITTWEIIVLSEKNQIILDTGNPSAWIRKVYTQIPFREAPISHEVAFLSRELKLPHQDPADRFLAATAKIYDMTLVTADKRLLSSKEFKTMPN